jgi:putative hydrolase of the HAD superfamily
MKKLLSSSLRVFVFDLDDTLYDESLFVQGGTNTVLEWLAAQYSLELQSLNKLMDSITKSFPRSEWYQRLIEKAGIRPSQELIDKMVEIYRNHTPDIHLPLDSSSFLSKIRSKEGVYLGLITDGMVSVQELKAKRLGLHKIMDLSVFTWNKGQEFQKPHPWSFKYIEKKSGAFATECCYFGNDPVKDFLAPNRLGWSTVCICRNGKNRIAASNKKYMAQIEISSFEELRLD